MARSRTRKSTRAVRFVKNPRPTERRRPPKVRAHVQSARGAEPVASPRSRASTTGMPGWGALEKGNRREGVRRGGWDVVLDSVPTMRLSLWILSAAILVTLYVGHVHSTQQLAAEVQDMSETNLTLHLRYNRVKGAFDRASGPSVIYERARRLGLSESLPNGFPVIID